MSVFDLSHYQPLERIQELADGGNCDGIILKIGERYDLNGEIELEPGFVEKVNKCVELGLPYGIYFMSRARNLDEMMAETQWINDIVAEYLNGTEPSLGTWWDIERKEVMRDDIWNDLKEVIATMQGWWNNSDKIGIYGSTINFFAAYCIMDELEELQIPIWSAQYQHGNYLMDKYPNLRHVLWQFTTNENYQDENHWYGF